MPAKQLSLLEMFGKGAKKEVIKRAKRAINDASQAATEAPKQKRAFISPSSSSNNEQEVELASSTSSTIAAISSAVQQNEVDKKKETPPMSSSPKQQQESAADDGAIIVNNWPNLELAPIFSTLVDPKWRSLLEPELKKDYLKGICKFLGQQYDKRATIFPPRHLIFNAFNLTPFNKIRVVLIGQDPYHNLHQAHGLCFSVPNGIPAPPSLKNMFKELSTEYPSFEAPNHGCLESWANQGVFLLNATLTVEAHKANSHSDIGWQTFTDSVIQLVSQKSNQGVVFLLWGGFAQRKEALVDKRKHRVIKAAHPSPLSAYKFFGCKCFSQTNAKLKELGRPPIDWTAF